MLNYTAEEIIDEFREILLDDYREMFRECLRKDFETANDKI